MPEITTKPRVQVKPQVERPKLYKVILINDDFTPREFVVTVLKGEFKLSEDQAHRVMITGIVAASASSPCSPGMSPRPRRRVPPMPARPRAIH